MASLYMKPPALPPALPRSISTTNLEITGRCRSVIEQDFVSEAPPGGTNFFTSTPYFTLTLPSFVDFPADFRQFVFGRLIDKETQRYLEGEKVMNWCPSATTLVPVNTMGDGNNLLHAASLGMWGFQDRDLILRRAVSSALRNHQGNTLYQRWKHYREEKNRELGLELEPHQWQAEWDEVVQQASAESAPGRTLESLDDFHVFVLTNILRRPIIMYAAPKMRSVSNDRTLQNINFYGVYLPLLWDHSSCKKDPLPLAYYGGHFTALTTIESAQQYQSGSLVLPLVNYYGELFPVRYMVPIEDPIPLMMDYLDLIQINQPSSPYVTNTCIVCARLTIPESPAYLKPLITKFIEACRHFHIQLPQAQSASQQQQKIKKAPEKQLKQSKGKGRFIKQQLGLSKQESTEQIKEPKQRSDEQLQQKLTEQESVLSSIRIDYLHLKEALKEEQEKLRDRNQETTQLENQLRDKSQRLLQKQRRILETQYRQQMAELTETNARLENELRDQQEETGRLTNQITQVREQLTQSQEELRHEQEALQQEQEQRQQQHARIEAAIALIRGEPVQHQVGMEAIELWEIARDDVQISGNILGTGAWGYVAKGTFQGQNVAVKCIHQDIISRQNVDRFRREINIMAQIRHPNMVLLIGAVLNENTGPLIVTELLDTSLRAAYGHNRIEKQSKLPILRDVASALVYLHSHRTPIIHRDVSSANVLLSERSNSRWIAKLSDFGSANLILLANTPAEGAPPYAAPEVGTEDQAQQTPKIDVYSFGVLLSEVWLCRFPPDRLEFPAMLTDLRQSCEATRNQGMFQLARDCTNRSPRGRPIMRIALDHIIGLITPAQ